jgi:tellurite resistance protein TehA-like permease
MATGLASEVAPMAHAGPLQGPLLWMAVVIAVAINIKGAIAFRRSRHDLPLPLPIRFGQFTVPIGLEVLASGLDRIGDPAALGGAAATTVVAWTLTAVLIARIAQLLPQHRGRDRIDGVWFLAPAALLADAIGIAGMTEWSPASTHDTLGWLAAVALGSGTIGYAAVFVLAAIAFTRSKMADHNRSSWWIAAGCGGLGAAAVGRVTAVAPFAATAASHHVFGWSALGFWAAGTTALVPVLAGSLCFVVRIRHLKGAIPWTPTFSTGVYALGAGALARLFDIPAFSTIAVVTAIAMLLMWMLTVFGRLATTATHQRRSRPDACGGAVSVRQPPRHGPTTLRCRRGGVPAVPRLRRWRSGLRGTYATQSRRHHTPWGDPRVARMITGAAIAPTFENDSEAIQARDQRLRRVRNGESGRS